MPAQLINPFVPHHPIDPRHFVGRENELRRLESALEHTKHKKPINFMITGERGIGKTSLLNYVQTMARSYSDSTEDQLNFIVVSVQIESSTTQLDFVRKVEVALRHELERIETVQAFFEKAWAFVQRLEVAGVSIRESTESRVLWEEFASSLIQTVTRICTQPKGRGASSLGGVPDLYDGLLLLIDEVDTASEKFEVGAFLKYLTEYFQRHGCNLVLIGLSGLPQVVNVLLRDHRSVLRVFEEIPLNPLANTEVATLIELFLKAARDENNCLFDISSSASEFIMELSDGHPHFIQQHCYCAFNAMAKRLSDSDLRAAKISFEKDLTPVPLVIEYDDVAQGSFSNRGAIDLIGDMYFSDVLQEGSEEVGVILALLAQVPSEFVSRQDLFASSSVEDSLLTAGLVKLKKLGIVIYRREDDSYRLRHRCLAYWLQKSGYGPQIQL